MNKRILAFDFGASSGRAMIGTYNGETLELEEIHRFSNDPVIVNGTMYWDTLRLFYEIKQGIVKAKPHLAWRFSMLYFFVFFILQSKKSY